MSKKCCSLSSPDIGMETTTKRLFSSPKYKNSDSLTSKY